jgi:hypothetical protein
MCTKCGEAKEISDFYILKRTGKPNGRCKPCTRNAAAQRRERIAGELPQLQRGYDLKRRYGISSEDYERLLAEQRGSCAICGGGPGGSARHFHVDHQHDTGEVRGLLCGNCNRGLGYLCEDPEIVRTAAEYLLRRHQ